MLALPTASQGGVQLHVLQGATYFAAFDPDQGTVQRGSVTQGGTNDVFDHGTTYRSASYVHGGK